MDQKSLQETMLLCVAVYTLQCSLSLAQKMLTLWNRNFPNSGLREVCASHSSKQPQHMTFSECHLQGAAPVGV